MRHPEPREREEEDGMGFSGLAPTAAERRQNAYEETRRKIAQAREATLAKITAENERLRRLLWLIIKSNGGYTLERHDIEQWPGADRGEVVTMEDPTTGNFVFSAVTNGKQDDPNQSP